MWTRYQKNKARFSKNAGEKFQNLSEEEKDKKYQYARKRYRNISEEDKDQYGHKRCNNFLEDEEQRLAEYI